MKEVIDTVSVALANGDTENVGNVVMQEVNRTLLSAGVDEVWADKIDNLIVLLFIIGIALLANIICRKIILRVVAKLVKQTKATWDDIVFNHSDGECQPDGSAYPDLYRHSYRIPRACGF